MSQIDIIDKIKKEHTLKIHLILNFYPPQSIKRRQLIATKFNDYWFKEITIEQLSDDTGIELEYLYHQFYDFLNKEDLDEQNR